MESHEQNELKSKTETNSESRLTAVGGRGWGLGREGGDIELKKKKKTRKNSSTGTVWWLLRRGPGGRWKREGRRGVNGDGRILDLGWWTHSTVYRWCVVGLCTWSLYNFVNLCHPSKRNKKQRKWGLRGQTAHVPSWLYYYWGACLSAGEYP